MPHLLTNKHKIYLFSAAEFTVRLTGHVPGAEKTEKLLEQMTEEPQTSWLSLTVQLASHWTTVPSITNTHDYANTN